MPYERETSPGYLTNWAARLFTRSLERRLGGPVSGLMSVFFALQGGQQRAQKEIARIAAVEQPTMARTLMRMERDGLVTRRPDPDDGRSSLVALTARGEERAEAAFGVARQVNAMSLEALEPAEQAQFIALLNRIVRRLQQDGEDDTVS